MKFPFEAKTSDKTSMKISKVLNSYINVNYHLIMCAMCSGINISYNQFPLQKAPTDITLQGKKKQMKLNDSSPKSTTAMFGQDQMTAIGTKS